MPLRADERWLQTAHSLAGAFPVRLVVAKHHVLASTPARYFDSRSHHWIMSTDGPAWLVSQCLLTISELTLES